MPKCDVRIETEDGAAEPVVVAGSVVRGTVVVTADADVSPSGVTIRHRWWTHGRGNPDKGGGDPVPLDVGAMTAGETRRVPFEVPVDSGPPTIAGTYINVDHDLVATVRLPWAFDPEHAVPLRVVGGTIDADDHAATTLPATVGYACGVLAIAAFVGIAATVATLAVHPIAGVVVVAVAAVGLVVWFLKHALPRWKIGSIELTATTDPSGNARVIRLSAAIDAKTDRTLGPWTATVRATEVATSGFGTDKTTRRNVVFEQTVTLEDTVPLRRGGRVVRETELRIAPELPPSLELSDNKIRWAASTSLSVPRFPDLTTSTQFTVPPSGPVRVVDRPAAVGGPAGDNPLSFTDLTTTLRKHRGDEPTIDRVVDAVAGLTFQVDAIAGRRMLYAGGEKDVRRGDDAIEADADGCDLLLIADHDVARQFDDQGRRWTGRAKVLSYDHRHGRLRMRVEASDAG